MVEDDGQLPGILRTGREEQRGWRARVVEEHPGGLLYSLVPPPSLALRIDMVDCWILGHGRGGWNGASIPREVLS